MGLGESSIRGIVGRVRGGSEKNIDIPKTRDAFWEIVSGKIKYIFLNTKYQYFLQENKIYI